MQWWGQWGPLALSAVSLVVCVGFVVVQGAEVTWPVVGLIVVVTVLPLARAFGSRRARQAGRDLRARREGD